MSELSQWRAPKQIVWYTSVSSMPCSVVTALSHSHTQTIRYIFGEWVVKEARLDWETVTYACGCNTGDEEQHFILNSYTLICQPITLFLWVAILSCMCVPIPPSSSKVPLITFVTAKEPAPPTASATKAIFSLATGMTHFLHHYKATSLAFSQMVSLVVHSCSLSLLLRKLLALEQLAQLSINNNHCAMVCKEEDWCNLCSSNVQYACQYPQVWVWTVTELISFWHKLMKAVATSHYASSACLLRCSGTTARFSMCQALPDTLTCLSLFLGRACGSSTDYFITQKQCCSTTANLLRSVHMLIYWNTLPRCGVQQ